MSERIKFNSLIPEFSVKYIEKSKWFYIDILGFQSTNETPQEKQLIIRDNGIGITPQELPRIFNRGFTGETGRTYSKSTGMGLYLAQQLSNKLGHYITCTSEVSSYTEYIIHFPKDDDPFLFMNKEKQ
ncbi:hypothetical protein J45TS6_44410 [Paenibacillus sp. J45TS6]|uniref:ATP-binding protein n=1 Tax=Bacillales TaxID=1385 RepID=UPI00047148E0|nr:MULTISPECIES: ATP-binding protein [Bacillales]GIP45982.1 hypothetical protein J45TS6_44410 [Paenibacillus sp. J45TS6]